MPTLMTQREAINATDCSLSRQAEVSAVVRRLGSLVLGMTLVCLTACDGRGPATPTGADPPPNGEPFEVTGVVTDDQGVPVADAAVTMRYWLGGFIKAPSVLTEAPGGYTISFTSNPWMMGTSGRGAARAEIVAEGYEQYQRTVIARNPPLVENFRLRRIQRIAAGDSFVLAITPDDSECLNDLLGPCRTLRVAAAFNGNLTVEAVPIQHSGQRPQLVACCAAGNERGGNPLTIPMGAGTELRLEVGLGLPRGAAASQSILLETSFDPS
jgi:hypothetical protein